MFLRLDEIQTVQLDHTSRCNLRCPQCARTAWHGGVNANVPANRDLTVENYRAILAPFRERSIKIFHCGSYGDAIASPTFPETLDFCLTYAPLARFTVITNGSLRTPEWWEDLGRKFAVHSENRVCFSVDGLEDTNPIYRLGSDFKKITANIAAFNKGGGRSRWDYLVFEHNRHQVGQARELARSLGVREFNVKNTSRFVVTDSEKYSATVQTSKTTVQDIEQNQNQRDFDHIQQAYGSFEAYAAQTPITCKYKNNQSVFIDFEMRLWPCCWVGSPIFADEAKGIQPRHIQRLFDKYGRDFNRLDLHGWGLLERDYFRHDLERSWTKDFADPQTPRLFTCGRTCGEKFEFSSGFGKNRQKDRLERGVAHGNP